jgi:glutathione S-transferase
LQFTLADLAAFEFLQILFEAIPGALDAHPLLAALRERVATRPNIAAYMSSPRRHPPPTPAYVQEVRSALAL